MRKQQNPANEANAGASAQSERHKILYYIGTIPIRRHNIISFYMPERDMVKVANACIATGLSAAKVIAHSARPCPQCKGKSVTIEIDDSGATYDIPRGLLSTNRTASGTTIHNRKRSMG